MKLEQVRKALAGRSNVDVKLLTDDEVASAFAFSLATDAEPPSDPPVEGDPLPAGAGDPPPPANDDEDDDSPPTDAEQNRSQDPAKGFAALLARHDNDGVAAARQLYGETRSLRAQKKLLSDENANLRASLPRGNKTVVTREQASLLREYQDLKMTPTALRAVIAERQELRQKDQTRSKEELLSTVASVAGFNLEALKHVGKDLDYKVTGEGADQKAVVRVKEGDTTTEVPVEDYANSHWQWAMNSLTTANDTTARRSGGSDQQRRAPAQLGPNNNNRNNSGKDKVSGHVMSRYDSVPIPGVKIEKRS